MAEVPRPRLCHIAKWSHFDGYGFNLHAEKAKPGQFIGKVDEGSPAEKAGLKEGDKIVEVNGVNINQENHKQVVQRIKAIPDQTRLLVLDQKAETYHRENGIIVKNTLPYVHHLSSESNMDEVDEVIDTTEQIVINGHNDHEEHDESPEESPQHTPERSPSPEPMATPEPEHKTVTREDSLDLRHSIHSDSIKSNRSSLSSEKELVYMKNQGSFANDNNVPSDVENVDSENNSNDTSEHSNEEGSVNSSNIDSYDVNEMPEKISINSRNSELEQNISIKSRKSEVEENHLISSKKSDKSLSETSSLGKQDKTEDVPVDFSPPVADEPPQYSKPFTSQESPHSLSSGSPRSTPSPTNIKNFDGLNLNMTAKEMRERIGSRKKKDPRKDERMDFRKKYEIIQTL